LHKFIDFIQIFRHVERSANANRVFTQGVHNMSRINIELTNEPLIGNAGLVSIGEMLRISAIDETCLHRESMANTILDRDILRSMVGLLTVGKTDFDHIRNFRGDDFFAKALGLKQVPSEATLRQRFQKISEDQRVLDELPTCSLRLLKKLRIKPHRIHHGKRTWTRVDMDPTVFDGSGAAKREGMSFAYDGRLGYQLVCGFLGGGIMLGAQLRTGSAHALCEGGLEFIKTITNRAKKVASTRLLEVFDSAFDSAGVIQQSFQDPDVDFIIKHNLRRESMLGWLETAKAHSVPHCPRPGKTVWRSSVYRQVEGVGLVRLVFEVIERTEKRGQLLLKPEVKTFCVWTSLDLPEKDVLRLYRDRGTCEQYFAEIKSELDLERPPSGKFTTNELFYQVGMLAYNMLRVMGHWLVNAPGLGLKKATRRRLRTVLHGVMLMCGRVVKHARRMLVKVVGGRGWGEAFREMQAWLCAA
jgi:hypothetical protein